jgi:hypothetical protein
MAVSSVHQREIVELSFRFLDGVERVHPALVVSVDELQQNEEGMFYAVLISSKNIHPEYTIEIFPDDIIGGDMDKKSYFVTHIIAYFTLNDIISRRNQFIKKDKFNNVVNTIIDNIFGDEL